MVMAAFHAGSYLLARLSPFGRMMALRGLVSPWQKGRLVAQFLDRTWDRNGVLS